MDFAVVDTGMPSENQKGPPALGDEPSNARGLAHAALPGDDRGGVADGPGHVGPGRERPEHRPGRRLEVGLGVLALLGAGDHAVDQLEELPDTLGPVPIGQGVEPQHHRVHPEVALDEAVEPLLEGVAPDGEGHPVGAAAHPEAAGELRHEAVLDLPGDGTPAVGACGRAAPLRQPRPAQLVVGGAQVVAVLQPQKAQGHPEGLVAGRGDEGTSVAADLRTGVSVAVGVTARVVPIAAVSVTEIVAGTA